MQPLRLAEVVVVTLLAFLRQKKVLEDLRNIGRIQYLEVQAQMLLTSKEHPMLEWIYLGRCIM
jgi:hypothetical protein